MNYWYQSRSDEIFLDLDSRRALRRAVSVLFLAIETNKLAVSRVFLYPTKQRGHFHLIIKLAGLMPRNAALAWGLWMGNDRLRVAYVLARSVDGRMDHATCSGDLLVSSKPYDFRRHDKTCSCTEKHKADEVTLRCPAMKALLGEARSADYFARTGERRVKPLRVRIKAGEVSITDLKKMIEASK